MAAYMTCRHPFTSGISNLSYFSGAGVLAVEGGELLLRGRNKFSRLGEALEEFGQFTRRVLPGTADVPVAVIVPEDHGWMTPPYWRTASEAWNYARIPYRPGDASMDGFFSAAFPGATFAMDPFPFGAYATNPPPASPFSLSSVTTRYAPLSENAFTATPPIHVRNVTEYGNSILLQESLKDLKPLLIRAFPENWEEVYAVLSKLLSVL